MVGLLSEHEQWNSRAHALSQYAILSMEVIHKNDGPIQDQVPKSRMKKSSLLLAIWGTQQDWHRQQDRMVGKTGCWKWPEKVLRSADVGSSASVVAASLAVACELGCGMWGLVPWPGIELEPPALGAWHLSHWTSREVPHSQFLMVVKIPVLGWGLGRQRWKLLLGDTKKALLVRRSTWSPLCYWNERVWLFPDTHLWGAPERLFPILGTYDATGERGLENGRANKANMRGGFKRLFLNIHKFLEKV